MFMDTCRAGHLKTEENSRWVSTKGKKFRRCKICDDTAKQRYEQSRKNRSFVKCLVDGCTTKQEFKGLCESHRKLGKPVEELSKLLSQESLLERVKKRVKVDDSGCWIWQNRLVKGYGYFTYRGKRMLTHRGTFEAFYQTTLSAKDVLDHLCMKKSCCNPEHLQRVTHRENSKRSQAFYSLEEKYNRLVKHLKLLGYSDSYIERISCGEEQELSKKVAVS